MVKPFSSLLHNQRPIKLIAVKWSFARLKFELSDCGKLSK